MLGFDLYDREKQINNMYTGTHGYTYIKRPVDPSYWIYQFHRLIKLSPDIRWIVVNVKNWKIGDKICALVSGGGYAQYCTAPSGQCLPIPKGFSYTEAAGIPETFFTVWSNIVDRAKIKKGQSILIHGGSGGIGTCAIQLAKVLGCTVYVTAGSDKKCKFCKKIGANEAINYKKTDFEKKIKDITQRKGVDVILDSIGGNYVEKNIKILNI